MWCITTIVLFQPPVLISFNHLYLKLETLHLTLISLNHSLTLQCPLLGMLYHVLIILMLTCKHVACPFLLVWWTMVGFISVFLNCNDLCIHRYFCEYYFWSWCYFAICSISCDRYFPWSAYRIVGLFSYYGHLAYLVMCCKHFLWILVWKSRFRYCKVIYTGISCCQLSAVQNTVLCNRQSNILHWRDC
jgi:hypothetical protein